MPAKHGRRQKKRQNGRSSSQSYRHHEEHSVSIPTGDLNKLAQGTVRAMSDLPDNGPSFHESNASNAVEALPSTGEQSSDQGTRTRVVLNLEAFKKVILKETESGLPQANKLCLEYKKKYAGNFMEEDVEEITRHFAEQKAEQKAQEEAKASKREAALRALVESKLGSAKSTAMSPVVPDSKKKIANANFSLPRTPVETASGWMVMEGQWLTMFTIQTYVPPTEWKVTELFNLDNNRVAILGRNGYRKTLVEVYNITVPRANQYEKTFIYDNPDAWQFGAKITTKRIVLGCQHEIGILDWQARRYSPIDIRRRVKGWDSKRIRALAADLSLNRIIVANDKDRLIIVLDINLQALNYIVVQEPVDFIWSLSMSKDRIYMCCGMAGTAFATDWNGRTLFHFKEPETQSSAVPAIVTQDCDSLVHVFWLVKIEGSFRAVDFYFNVLEDKHIAEVRLDKKVKYMDNVSCATLDPTRDNDGHTVVMTDEGDLYISATIVRTKTEEEIVPC